MSSLSTSFRLFLWLTFLTGIVYPLVITLIGYTLVNNKRTGDIIFVENRPIGAKLIGQKFESDHYFHGRPSNIDFNPLNSGGKVLGPTSLELRNKVAEREEMIAKKFKFKGHIPSELLFASASGLDPHISKEAALLQVDNVMAARGLNAEHKHIILKLIDEQNSQLFKKHGKSYINVLLLNHSLDLTFRSLM